MLNNKFFKASNWLPIFLEAVATLINVSPASAALRDDDLTIQVVSTAWNNDHTVYEGYSMQALLEDYNGGYGGVAGNGAVYLVGNQLVIEDIYGGAGPFDYMFISSGTKNFASATPMEGVFTSDDIAVNKLPAFAVDGRDGPGIWINLNNITQPGDRSVIAITTVPEPETYAMMLLGLVLIGAALKRRGRAN